MIDVQKLVTLDPVNDGLPRLFKGARTVEPNVKSHTNYYQRKGGDSTINLVDQATHQPIGRSVTYGNWFSKGIKGSSIATNAIRVDDPAPPGLGNAKAEHEWGFHLGVLRDGRLYGNDVNHDTMPWFLYERAKNDLQ